MPELVDHLIDGGIFLNIGIAGRDIGFGLIIVVVADKILHRIFGEKLPEFMVELGRQGLVGRDNQRRPLDPGDHMGHGKRLAGAGHAEQHLVVFPEISPQLRASMAPG